MSVPVWGWVVGAGVALLVLGAAKPGARTDIAPVYARALDQEKDVPTLRTFASTLRAAGYDFQADMLDARADGISQGAPLAQAAARTLEQAGPASGGTLTAAQVGLQAAAAPVAMATQAVASVQTMSMSLGMARL